jgi:lysophospholipase
MAVPEHDYAATIRDTVMPWRDGHAVPLQVVGVGGVVLDAVRFPAVQGAPAVVVVGGRTESHRKYAELFYDLSDTGWALYAYDHRGQGLSGRLLGDADKQHVERFDDYVDDLELFIDNVVRPRGHRKVFLLAHSMGALVATRLVQLRPRKVDAVVLCSPMHRFNTDPFPEAVAQALAAAGVAAGEGDAYALGQGPRESTPFEDNSVTTSRARYNANEAAVAADPRLGLGGVTYNWVREAFSAASSARHDAGRLRVPTLLLQSGDDSIVRNDGSDAVCNLARDCRKARIPGARHELLAERDDLRDDVLRRVREFLAQQAEASDGWDDPAGCAAARGGAGEGLLLLALVVARRRVRQTTP